ncbi:hypothetical protein SAMN05216436_103104 [bacterium A37T11]|nr:hypothetical protein SAMN05216436_103104 [bacterium A37T11]
MIVTTLFSYILTAANLLPIQQAADTLVDSLPAPIYFEPADSGKTRFYYDEQYYLADKNCQYAQIERLSNFNALDRVFEGHFEDYGPNGNLILEGNYAHGIKSGPFKAYHNNGKTKWEGAFENNQPTGLWRYYYPDGRPFQEISFENNKAALVSYWNNRGNKEVTEGNGKYQFAVKAIDFNEYGYTFIQSRGRIKDGVPNGFWNIDYLFPGGKKEDAGYEQFKNGIMLDGFDNYTGEEYDDKVRTSYIPPESFSRAEELTSKNCNVDDHEGFNEYLRKRLEVSFSGYDATSLDPQHVIVKIKVSKSGLPLEIIADSTFANKIADHILLQAFRTIPYWIPSYSSGEYITDMFTISADAFPSLNSGLLEFYNVRIKREKGI